MKNTHARQILQAAAANGGAINLWPRVDRARENELENAFGAFAYQQKWAATKKGWPDFLVKSQTGEIFCVEVKPRLKKRDGFQALKIEQIACLDWLTSLGVRCYISDGEIFERYGDRHRRGLPPFIAASNAALLDPAGIRRRRPTLPG